MKYFLKAYVQEIPYVPIHDKEFYFDTLEEALKLYDMFDGIESYNKNIQNEISVNGIIPEIIYSLELGTNGDIEMKDFEDTYVFMKQKYKTLDLED